MFFLLRVGVCTKISLIPSLDIFFVLLIFRHCEQCFKQYLCTSISDIIISLGESPRNGIARYKIINVLKALRCCLWVGSVTSCVLTNSPKLQCSSQDKPSRRLRSALLPGLWPSGDSGPAAGPGIQTFSWQHRGSLEYPFLERYFHQKSKWQQALCLYLRIRSGSTGS